MRPARPVTSRETALRRFSWTLLLGLLLSLLGAAFVVERDWPDLLPGEATALMQATSLAEDFDLSYTRTDHDRLLLTWNGQPPDLALASLGGERIGFALPFPQAVWLAPFLRFSPKSGFAIANAVLLLIVALLTAVMLERRLGAAAPLWTAVLLFASVTFAHVFLATGSLFLFAVAALAFLCLDPEFQAGRSLHRRSRTSPWRFWTAGALIAIAVATDPLYLFLLLAAVLIPAGRDRAVARTSVLFGFGVSLAMMLAVAWWTSGALLWLVDGGFRFTPETGFPLVDFTAAEWKPAVKRFSALYWEGAPRFSYGLDIRLGLWNALYLALGRHFGILPYFAPVLLLILTAEIDRPRQALLGSTLLGMIALLIFRPFALNGTEGTIGLSFFLPFYGALFMLPARMLRTAPQLAFGAGVIVLIAAPFLGRLWLDPASYPVRPESGHAHVTAAAERLLPYETSQRWIPSGQLVEHQGLWIRFLNDGAWAETRRQRLVVDGDAEVTLMVASGLKLDVLRFEFGEAAPSAIELRGAELGERVLSSDGGIVFRLLPGSFPRRHATWWTPQPQYLYLLTFRLPKAGEQRLPFRLIGEQRPGSG